MVSGIERMMDMQQRNDAETRRLSGLTRRLSLVDRWKMSDFTLEIPPRRALGTPPTPSRGGLAPRRPALSPPLRYCARALIQKILEKLWQTFRPRVLHLKAGWSSSPKKKSEPENLPWPGEGGGVAARDGCFEAAANAAGASEALLYGGGYTQGKTMMRVRRRELIPFGNAFSSFEN